MFFTRKRHISRSHTMQTGFLGYCPQEGNIRNRWFHEENLSSRSYPLLRPREPRRRLSTEVIDALGDMNGLCYLSGKVLHYGSRQMPLPVSDGEKELLTFGAYVLILPDMIRVNTAEDTFEYCVYEKEFTMALGICWCNDLGEPLETVILDPEAPENTAQYWLDPTDDAFLLKEYSADLGKWLPVEPTYVRLNGEGIGADLITDSRILIEACPELAPIVGTGLCRVCSRGRDFVVLEGSLTDIRVEFPLLQFRITSPMPRMDYMIQCENRLWGCRYGMDHNGNFVNEIYASALGNPKDWYRFRGIASDSYVVSIGASGPFTGAAVVGGYPVFFKEQSIHKITGSRPSTYQLRSTSCVGVAPGSHKSIAILDDNALYLGRDGFYVYDGTLPQKISSDLKGMTYTQGVGGVLDGVYYVGVLEEGKEAVVLTYDRSHGIWHRETGLRPKEFLSSKGVLYYRTEEPGLFAIGTQEGTLAEPPIRWEAVTPMFRRETLKSGYFTGLRLRLTLPLGSSVQVFVEYDSHGEWVPLGTVGGPVSENREIPLRIRRCDHFRLKLCGTGDGTIHNMIVTMEG